MTFRLLVCISFAIAQAKIHVVTDPDGTSLSTDNSEHSSIRSHLMHKSQGPIQSELLAERRIAKLKAHLEQAEVRALEQDIRKQILKAAELKFEAERQRKLSSEHISSLTASKAVETRISKIPNIVHGEDSKTRSEHHRKTWYASASSTLFESASKEDEERQNNFHEELIRVRNAVARAQKQHLKELAKQRLKFKLRAMQTVQKLAESNADDRRAILGAGEVRRAGHEKPLQHSTEEAH